jgi:hypothetical protein
VPSVVCSGCPIQMQLWLARLALMVGYLCHEQTSEEHHYPVQAAEPVSLEVEKVICMKWGGVAAGDGRPMHITSSSVCATWSFAWVRRMMGGMEGSEVCHH